MEAKGGRSRKIWKASVKKNPNNLDTIIQSKT